MFILNQTLNTKGAQHDLAEFRAAVQDTTVEERNSVKRDLNNLIGLSENHLSVLPTAQQSLGNVSIDFLLKVPQIE